MVSTELNVIPKGKAKYLLDEIDQIKKMLAALIKKIKDSI